MAKIKGLPRLRQIQALRGAVCVYFWQDQQIAKAWPRKRGKPTAPKQAARVAWFKSAVQGIKRMEPSQFATAIETTHGSLYMPRDALMTAMAGNLITCEYPSHGTMYPRRYLVKIQNTLDAISQVEGTVLYRGPIKWDALTPGTKGHVLQTNGNGKIPSWEKPVGGTDIKTARINRTTNLTHEDGLVPFQVAEYQDLAFWDASDPASIVAPADGKMRVVFGIATGGKASSGDNADIRLNGAYISRGSVYGYGTTVDSGWKSVSAGDIFDLVTFFTASETLAGTLTFASVDFIPAS